MKKGSFSPHFCLLTGGFLVVVMLAQALVVVWIDEQIPVTTEGHNVVNHGSRCSVPWIVRREQPAALAAERFTQQLIRPELVCPDWELVPPMIRRATPPAVLWLVFLTPAIPGQRRASRMLARS